uniref:RNA-directed RNA polymerase catalytic subunit n=1 Tax=Hubei orthoptera virus 6 TaxID=1923014 RepID=A0A1L3KKP6_9VIRU|nr:polymerase PB1 [Hubei orthoptera virus 6]
MNLFTPKMVFTPTDTQELIYPYSGPPPMAYGSHTRLVLENVTRSYKYNNPTPNTGVKTTSKALKDFTYEQPGAYYNKNFLLACTHRTYDKWQSEIKEALDQTQRILFHQKYADLSKGRQTWSFIQERNIPAAMALKETVEMIESNLGTKLGQSLGEYNQAILDLFEMDSIKCPKYQFETDSNGVSKKKRKIVKYTASELWGVAATINTMSKSAERGKLKRRSIATPNMLLRGFVKFAEDLAAEILKRLPSSGIPVGGQEKLAKLTSIMGMATSKETGELSGDEEKWNECLDPDAMRIVMTTFMQRSNMPKWIVELIQIPFLFFKGKRAILGPGIPLRNRYGHTKCFPLDSENLPEDCNQYKFIIPLLDKESNTLLCRVGMFMGMFNFMSTLLALVTVEGRDKDTKHVQSSDDFIHFFEGESQNDITCNLAPKLYLAYRAVGINESPSKCILIIPSGIGEFNSQYHHKDFVGNVGTELPSITPAGFNPASDMTMGLRVIRNALSTFQMLLPTASLALRLFLKAYRHAYLVEGETERKRYIKSLAIDGSPVVFQGGSSPFSVTTLHLEEVALKRRNGDIDEQYIRRIMNPDNPFSGGQAVLTLKNESKRPVLEEDTTVGSCFKFQFARNRTVLNTQFSNGLKEEKAYSEVTKAIESIMPEVQIGITSHTGSVETALRARIEALIESSSLNAMKKKELFEKIDQDVVEGWEEDSD